MNTKDKINKLKSLFSNSKDILKKIADIDPDGEKTNECFILLKDLAHCGGNSPAPISIMRAGTVFKNLKDTEYFSDGLHVIARSVATYSKDYFIYLTEEEGSIINKDE